MKRHIIVAFLGAWVFSGVATAQPLAGTNGGSAAIPPIAPTSWTAIEPAPPAPTPPRAAPAPVSPGSPGELQASPQARAHELHLMEEQAAAESVHRAAVARAEQRSHRLESQRWFGISNTRPAASSDPYNGDYSAYWASNYPFYPLRWVGSGEPWGFVETER